MLFERFIARRYLISKHKLNFISIISFLSTFGITIGVAALIVVLSVFNGFGSLVKLFLMNFDPHVRIELISTEYSENDLVNLRSYIDDIEYVDAYAPFVSGKVLAVRKGQTEVINLKGVDANKADDIYKIKNSVIIGSDALSSSDGVSTIIIGIKLADQLQVLTGDTITLISPAGIERIVTQFALPKTQSFVVGGIFSSQNNDYDAGLAFVELNNAQQLLGYGDSFQGYELRLNDFNKASDVQNTINQKINSGLFSVSTWFDFHKDLYTVMQIERWAAYILLSLIIAVATFNILGSLSMTVIEKKRDIGILRAMGVKESSIKKIFMYEGLMIGIIGTAAGVIIGYFICFLQLNYNIYPLDPSQYKIDSLPIELRLADFFLVAAVSMVLSFLASYFPANRATRTNIIEAIKWE